MSTSPNEAAASHLPMFITPPGHTDVLLVITAAFLLVAVISVGLFFWYLHALPERIAHKSQKLQFEIVAVLALISLFTHEHIYWIIGLLLAFIELPDFGTPINRMANALEDIAKDTAPIDASPIEEAPDATDGMEPVKTYSRQPHAEGSVHA